MSLPKFKSSIVDSRSTIVNKKGFSLIELLVVISIIGLLTAIGTASLTNAQQKGRDARRKSDLKATQQAFELYFQQNGRYPPNVGRFVSCDGTTSIPWGNAFTCGSNTYLQKLPSDPTYPAGDVKEYYYLPSGSNNYSLFATLENTLDPDMGGPCSVWPIDSNYCVINP